MFKGRRLTTDEVMHSPLAYPLKVTIEIERCKNCETHRHCTWHNEAKYDKYEQEFRQKLVYLIEEGFKKTSDDYDIVTNAGPLTRSIMCCPAGGDRAYGLYRSLVYDDAHDRWVRDEIFRYPQMGCWEVYVHKGNQRIMAYSKSETRKWPDLNDVVERTLEIIEDELQGGWDLLPIWLPPKQDEDVIERLSDDELRALVAKKHNSLQAMFRAFDKNNDNLVSRSEFFLGIAQCGIKLPEAQHDDMWRLIDEDGSGNVDYGEFCCRMSKFKASTSIGHFGNKKEGPITATALRKEVAVTWGADNGKSIAEMQKGVKQKENEVMRLARDGNFENRPVDDLSANEIRAIILQKHGGSVNAFRHFDSSSNGKISWKEFEIAMPKCLTVLKSNKSPSTDQLLRIWKMFDTNDDGDIMLNELIGEHAEGHYETAHNIRVFKGRAVEVAQPSSNKAKTPAKDRLAARGVQFPPPEKPKPKPKRFVPPPQPPPVSQEKPKEAIKVVDEAAPPPQPPPVVEEKPKEEVEVAEELEKPNEEVEVAEQKAPVALEEPLPAVVSEEPLPAVVSEEPPVGPDEPPQLDMEDQKPQEA